MFKRLPAFASLVWPSLLCAALVGAACHHPPPDPDMGTVDMAVPADLGSPPDLLCSPADPMCAMPDMRKAEDMKTPEDMSKPDMSGMDGGSPDMSGMDGGSPDMSGMDGGSPDMTTPDMSMGMDGGSPDMTMGMGGIGAPCTADTDCKAGPMPTCWKANVLNNPGNAPTKDGYCSAKCTVDTDCGGGANCVNVGADKYCLKSCSDATTCRHTGYACAFFSVGGVCYPDSIFDCDPKASGGTCTESGSGKAGGCLRGAYEDKGNCSASCNVGPGNCDDRPMGVKRQCIWVDLSKTTFMDAYKGLICAQSPAMPKMVGASCSFLNECVDGAECDSIDGKCRTMCVKGGMPGCATGMCMDDLMTPTGGPGLCR